MLWYSNKNKHYHEIKILRNFKFSFLEFVFLNYSDVSQNLIFSINIHTSSFLEILLNFLTCKTAILSTVRVIVRVTIILYFSGAYGNIYDNFQLSFETNWGLI